MASQRCHKKPRTLFANDDEHSLNGQTSHSQPRGRNATALAVANPIASLDTRISFEEAEHAYFIDGVYFDGPSVTGLVSQFFAGDKFNGPLIIERYLSRWREDPEHKYHDVVKGLNDDEATTAILKTWEATSTLGTLLHKVVEMKLNNESYEVPEDVTKESQQFEKFMEDYPSLKPFRTELSMFYSCVGQEVVACGQADAIFYCVKSQETWIVDFKRTDKNLEPDAHDFDKPGLGPMSGMPGNDFNKYSLQQSVYALMAAQHGIKVDKCFLLQMHPRLESYRLHECADFRQEARKILNTFIISVEPMADEESYEAN